MLYELFYGLNLKFSFINVTKYISFRFIMALLSALVFGIVTMPGLIRFFKKREVKQIVRDDGPSTHFVKRSVPTMGGAVIILSILLPTLLWAPWTNRFIWYCVFITGFYAWIGFLDDYAKLSKKNPKGISGKTKLTLQTLGALIICVHNYYMDPSSSFVSFPFIKGFVLDLGLLYIPFAILVMVGCSNAVNLTDGLDGLAIVPMMIAAGSYSILTYISGNKLLASYLNFPYISGTGDLSIVCACIIGAGLAFLWYNAYPAQIFMGDIGSLPLGGLLGAIAVFSKHEIILSVIGGVFVIEAVSVITQVVSFKYRGKRIFRMAPIHHHFELKGWAEPKVIVRFWIISFVFALIGLLSVKIR